MGGTKMQAQAEDVNRYDLVLHFRTVAHGKTTGSLYNKARVTTEAADQSCIARPESAEEAIKQCDEIGNAWESHKHVRRIENCSSFEDKVASSCKEILQVLAPHSVGSPRKS